MNGIIVEHVQCHRFHESTPNGLAGGFRLTVSIDVFPPVSQDAVVKTITRAVEKMAEAVELPSVA